MLEQAGTPCGTLRNRFVSAHPRGVPGILPESWLADGESIRQ